MLWMTRRSIAKTAEDLDDRDLVDTIARAERLAQYFITDDPDTPNAEFDSGPLAKAWQGYEFALCIYGMMLCMEYHMNRGYADGAFFRFKALCEEYKSQFPGAAYAPPPWFKDVDVLKSHRSALLRRDPYRYEDKWTQVPENWPYLCPVVDDDGGYKLFISKDDKALMRRGVRSALPADVKNKVANL